MTPWELTVLETIVAWTKKAWTSCQATLHIKKVSRKVYCYLPTVEIQRNDHGSASDRLPFITIYALFMLCFIYCGRLRAEEWGGRFSISIWGRTGSLEFQVPAPQVHWQPCLFSRCEGCTEVPSWRRGQDGDCRLLCRVSEIWTASCTKPFKNLRLNFCPGDKGRMGIVDFCAGCLKFGLPLVQSPSKISGPWPLSGCVNAMLLGRVSQPLWSWDIGRGSSFLSWHTKGIVVRVTRRDCPELLPTFPSGTHPTHALMQTKAEERSHKNDWWWVSSSHWPRCLGHEGGFCVVYKHKICDIAHNWSIKSQFLLIKITFIQTSIHSKYWQVSTHMPKKTGIGVIFPTLPPQLKHLVMGIIDFLTSFSTLCPERPRHPV